MIPDPRFPGVGSRAVTRGRVCLNHRYSPGLCVSPEVEAAKGRSLALSLGRSLGNCQVICGGGDTDSSASRMSPVAGATAVVRCVLHAVLRNHRLLGIEPERRRARPSAASGRGSGTSVGNTTETDHRKHRAPYRTDSAASWPPPPRPRVRAVVLVARDEAGTVMDDVGRLVGRRRAPDPRRIAPEVRRAALEGQESATCLPAAVVRGRPGE
jgi:hypothetical protein